METQELARPALMSDVMPVHGIDHLELFVGNAAQAAYYYTHAFGFTETAYRGLETGSRDRVSYVLEQGRIRLVLTGTLTGDDEIAEHHKHHGDGVHKIALSVPDAAAAYEHAVAHGARGVQTPYELEDHHGRVRLASVATYGETQHLFVQRGDYRGRFLPGFESAGPAAHNRPDGLLVGIDHVVGNVELGHMEEWVHYYERVFGMTEMIHFSDEAISTEYSALMSKVVTDGSGRIKFPINEPAAGQAQVADRGVPRLLSRRRRPAHRRLDHRHRPHGRRAHRPRRPLPPDPAVVLRGGARAGSARSTRAWQT